MFYLPIESPIHNLRKQFFGLRADTTTPLLVYPQCNLVDVHMHNIDEIQILNPKDMPHATCIYGQCTSHRHTLNNDLNVQGNGTELTAREILIS